MLKNRNKNLEVVVECFYRNLQASACNPVAVFLLISVEIRRLEVHPPMVLFQVTGGVANSGKVPTLCGTLSGQHIIYSAIPSFPARLSVVVDPLVR
jgi:hypothetical protein